VELGDEVRDCLRVELVDGQIAEARQEAPERDVVGLHRPGRDVDAGGLPAIRELPDGDGVRLGGRMNLWDASRAELAADPTLPLVCLSTMHGSCASSLASGSSRRKHG
jgi:hypothetical protein